MTFSFVVMPAPFLLLVLVGRGWICGHWFIKDNSRTTMKHFANDLQPYQHNDSSGGLMYIHGDVQFIFRLRVKAFFW